MLGVEAPPFDAWCPRRRGRSTVEFRGFLPVGLIASIAERGARRLLGPLSPPFEAAICKYDVGVQGLMRIRAADALGLDQRALARVLPRSTTSRVVASMEAIAPLAARALGYAKQSELRRVFLRSTPARLDVLRLRHHVKISASCDPELYLDKVMRSGRASCVGTDTVPVAPPATAA